MSIGRRLVEINGDVVIKEYFTLIDLRVTDVYELP